MSRLGLETAHVPHKDRHGLLWLGRGRLCVDEGGVRFDTPGFDTMPSGSYHIPIQTISTLILSTGVSITHDVFRVCANQNTGILIVGDNGVRLYSSLPKSPDRSALARKHVELWSDEKKRNQIARRMYTQRLGLEYPEMDIQVLRGLEGAKVKESYKKIAQQFGVNWNGRRYDRQNPDLTNLPNQVINHCAVAMYHAAEIAVACAGAIPQLGFIHEASGISFCLDIADLHREEWILPSAFKAVRILESTHQDTERVARQCIGETLRVEKCIHRMIDEIKDYLS